MVNLYMRAYIENKNNSGVNDMKKCLINMIYKNVVLKANFLKGDIVVDTNVGKDIDVEYKIVNKNNVIKRSDFVLHNIEVSNMKVLQITSKSVDIIAVDYVDNIEIFYIDENGDKMILIKKLIYPEYIKAGKSISFNYELELN